MSTIHLKNVQKAQGMVEFALVLPILLLVILGIFAFGHLFFVYSSVVSASREAARWGAAVGESPSSAPRYQDCTSIRAAAVRVGSFAGVNPNTVTINYDHGPVNPPNAPVVFANCPLAGTGPDSTQVERGDRIVVRVSVQYTPIVPFVNLPSFPLTAETGRTIVKSLPVGDAPIAEDPCVTATTITITPASPSSSLVGMPVTFNVRLTADDGTTPTGSVLYSDTDGTAFGPTVLSGGQAAFPVTFKTAGVRTISVRYEPDNECHMGSAVTNHQHTVNKGNTKVTIVDPNDPSGLGQPFYVDINVEVTTGAATELGPSGVIEVYYNGTRVCPTATISTALRSQLCQITPNQLGIGQITAKYTGDSNYNESATVADQHYVIPQETATFLPTPVVATVTPTQSPFCPNFENSVLSFSTPPNAFTIGLRNQDKYDLKISRVTVSWPTTGQTVKLKEVRFSDEPGIGNSCANNDHAQCIWWANNNNQALPNGNPLSITSSSSGNWSDNNPGILKNQQRFLYLLFTTDLASTGPYFLEVEFTDNAGHTCTTSPSINYTR